MELTPYRPGKPVEEIKRRFNLEKVIKLASNENPNPLPDNVKAAIQKEIVNLNTYPCSDSYYLRHDIARRNNIDADNVIIGCGSVEIIRMIINTFLRPGEKVLTSEMTFLLYKIAAIEKAGKNCFIEAPMDEHHTYDPEKILALVDNSVKIIFIANPNNPTGTMLSRKQIADLIARIPEDVIVVLDNAYQEYVSDPGDYYDGLETAVNRQNVIVLRTFSKIYGLAGLRIGYAISNAPLIAYLGRVKAPFNVTRIAQASAMAALQNEEYKISSARLNTKNRQKLFSQLTGLGLKVIPSEANFLLFFPRVNIPELNERLLAQGVIVRPAQAFGVPEGIRVTVGLEHENDFFIQALERSFNLMK